jgi:hypothetical protein
VSCGKPLPSELRGTPESIPTAEVQPKLAKRSVFRDFIAALRRHWRSELPSVSPLQTAIGCSLSGNGMGVPKASTFYAGVSRSLGLHVFVYFQHSPKSWSVGEFAANIILSKIIDAPEVWFRWEPDDGGPLTEGCYRVGPLLGKGDKWWCLRQTFPTHPEQHWIAASYDNSTQVIADAVVDVTSDVRAVLERLEVLPKVPTPPKSKKSTRERRSKEMGS